MKIANTRLAFTEGLIDLAAEDPRIVLVCADSSKVVKGDLFAARFPDRFFDVGIAEQDAVAMSAGLAACGLIPFVATYSGFLTMRACEQLRTFVAYPGLNVNLVGANGGISGGEREGVTHQFFEDLGITRSIPGITVVAPADASQVRQATKALAYEEGPSFLRIGNGRDLVVFDEPPAFELGKIRIIEEYGHDVVIFVNGSLILRALQAAALLAEKGIQTKVVEVHTLKPLDLAGIVDLLKTSGAAVTVEDHNIIGGLGSAIAELSVEHAPVPMKRIGLRDRFPESGASQALLDKYQMGVQDIVVAVEEVYKKI